MRERRAARGVDIGPLNMEKQWDDFAAAAAVNVTAPGAAPGWTRNPGPVTRA